MSKTMTRLLVFKRGNVVYKEVFVGTWLQLLMYKHKMRKWKITVENYQESLDKSKK